MTDQADNAAALRSRLRAVGLSSQAIRAAWPAWWAPEAEASVSARVELRFELARRLGLDPRSLIDPAAEPSFLWRGGRFKRLAAESQREQWAISSFGTTVGRLLLQASADGEPSLLARGPGLLRGAILDAGSPFVSLEDLLALAWAAGVAVAHLRVFPLDQKRMAAMSVRPDRRSAILLAKDAKYPAPIEFYLAHELGHIALGHIAAGGLVVDLEEAVPRLELTDREERAADGYAIELLTGTPGLTVEPFEKPGLGSEIARTVLAAAGRERIEPGILAQLYGFATGEWASVGVALRNIYRGPRDVAASVNEIARGQLRFDALPDDGALFLKAVLGSAPGA